MKKRTLALIMALVLMLSVAIPGTLAVSLDASSTETTFSLDTEAPAPIAEAPAEEEAGEEVVDEAPAEEPAEEPVVDEPVVEPADVDADGEEVEPEEAEPEEAEPEEEVDVKDVTVNEAATQSGEFAVPADNTVVDVNESVDEDDVTLPECTCPEGYQKQTDYDHDTDCALNLGRLPELSNEQMALLWPTLTETERAYILKFAEVNYFTNAQIEYIEKLEETQKKQDYCETITSVTDTAHGVTVSGVPAGVTLAVKTVEAEDAIVALDITLQRGGNDWQPYADEDFQKYTDGYVALTLDLSAHKLEDGTVVTLNHTHNGKTTDYLYVVIDGKITFYTDRFSVYVVSKAGETPERNATALNTENEYEMTVGESKTFYWAKTSGYPWNNRTVLGIVWSVSDSSNAVTYTVYANGQENGYQEGSDYWTWKAPWITVNAQRAGKVTVTATIYYRQSDYNGTTTTTTTKEFFDIKISEKTGFHIEDKIAETGCLVPVWDVNANTDTTGYTYTWTRSDGQTVRSEALEESVTVTTGTGDDAKTTTYSNGVNVAKDKGGVDIKTDGTTTEPVKYTLTVRNADGEEVGEDSYTVLYGQRVLNPSFETPDLGTENHRAYYNGYEGLYWKTTAPGTGNTLGQDVEIGSKVNGNPYGISETPDDGSQFAELNAEAVGTLYQDILTASGVALNWSFSHAARYDKDSTVGATTMYIVIAATKDAQSIVSEENISDLIDAAKKEETKDKSIPDAKADGSAAGFSFTYNNGTYVIWKHTATNNQSNPWSEIAGSYAVPDGQYLTRLFFASEPSNTEDTAKKTKGNLIDGVKAGQTMSYKIKYMVDGSENKEKTQTGKDSVYTTVKASNLESLLTDGYFVTEVKVNGISYPSVSEFLNEGSQNYHKFYIMKYSGESDEGYDLTFEIVIRKKAVIVEKVIEIDGWDSLTSTEKSALFSTLFTQTYTAQFALINSSGETVDTASVKIAGYDTETGKISAQAGFAQSSTLDGTYTVKEIEHGNLSGGYVLDSTSYTGGTEVSGGGVSVTINNTDTKAAVTVTNHYKIGVTSLTIKKQAAADTTFDSGETFVFTVKGEGLPSEGLKVVIQGTGDKTISGLKVGATYTVTEDTGWSWRYTPVDSSGNKQESQSVTLTANGNTVTFSNKKTNDKWLDGSTSVVNKGTANGITKG